MNGLNLTGEQKRELGKHMKYLGGNIIDINDHDLDNLNEVKSLFSLQPKGKKDNRVEYHTFDLLYDENDMNWAVVNEIPDRTIFYKYIDIINEIGILDPEFKNIRVHGVQAMKMTRTVIPAPEDNVGSRVIFNLSDPTCFLLTEYQNENGFYIRKYLPKNSYVLMGNAQHMPYYLVSKAGPYVFRPRQGYETFQRDNTDLKVPKRDSYNRITLAFDIYNPNFEPSNFVEVTENLNILKKKKRRHRKNKINKEERAALNGLKEGLQKVATNMSGPSS